MLQWKRLPKRNDIQNKREQNGAIDDRLENLVYVN